MRSLKKQLYLVAGIVCFGVFTGAASATPVGILNLTNCTGGGVTVTATTIDWLLPVGGGTGCIASDTGTNVTFTGGGPLLPGDTTGLIHDLPGSLTDFMLFTDQPNLHFDLVSIGPGVANTVCAATLNQNLASCSVAAGSAFILTPTSTGTAVALAANGIARDTTGSSAWLGNYTTQFPGITPAQIQDAILHGTTIPGFCSAGACTDTYSGSFSVTMTPEPASISMVLFGVAGLIGIGRKRFNKK